MAVKPPPPPKPPSTAQKLFRDRDALGAFVFFPEQHPPETVIYYNADFTAIHDRYPKGTVHCLLLPRSRAHTLQHPLDALSDDAAFLASVRAEAARLKTLVAQELRRLLGEGSRTEAPRTAVLLGERELAPGEELPAGRDWEADVKVGVHAHPSMSHLHVHVVSQDMHSVCMRHRKHYNSFNTPFLVELEAFPLARDDPRRKSHGWHETPLRCWRCGKDFGNRFKALKDHLEVEFEEWKRE